MTPLPKVPSAKDRFQYWMSTWSDIEQHLPRLYRESHGRAVELGTRAGASTAALLASLEEKGVGHLWSVDTDPGCRAVFDGHPQWTFVCGSSLELSPLDLPGILTPAEELILNHSHDNDSKCVGCALMQDVMPIDMLFVDTLHDFDHVLDELCRWVPYVKKAGNILVHDAETFAGVRAAMMEYCNRKGHSMTIIPGSNGLGVISKT